VKILQVICSTGLYGAERWVLALANNLQPQHLSCDSVAISDNPNASTELLDEYPADIGRAFKIEMNGRFDLKVIDKLCELIRERDIDLIHTHGYKSDIIGAICSKKCKVKCISTPHGFGKPEGWKLKLYQKLGCFSFRFMDLVVPLSSQLYDEVLQLKIDPSRVKLIENGVNLKEIASKVGPRVTRAEDAKKTIGYVGRLAPGKDVHEIIYMFDELWKKNQNIELMIVGDGELKTELEQLAQSLPSTQDIRFLGFRHDRLELLSKMDLFVMTSSSEGTPRCLMEALAIQTPIVAYSIPGVRQLVIHEKTGLLADLGDRQQLVAQSHRLLNDDELAQKLSESGRELVERKFSAARMASDYTDLFAAVLKTPPSESLTKAV